MPRPARKRVTQADIARAIRAVMREGLVVAGVDIRGDMIRVLTAPAGPGDAAPAEDWLGRLGPRNGGDGRAP